MFKLRFDLDVDLALTAEQFLESNIDLIDEDNFNELYARMPIHLVQEITSALTECGIDIFGRNKE